MIIIVAMQAFYHRLPVAQRLKKADISQAFLLDSKQANHAKRPTTQASRFLESPSLPYYPRAPAQEFCPIFLASEMLLDLLQIST